MTDKTKFSLEAHYRVYNDSDGSYIVVRPDTDCLGLVEVQQWDDGKCVARITMQAEAARLLSNALEKGASDADNYFA